MPAVSAGNEYHKTEHSGRHAPPGRWYGSRKAYMYMPHNMEYQCAACCFLGHQRGHWHLGVLADPSLPCPSFLDVWCPESRPGSRLAHLGEGYMGNKPRESVRRVNTMRQVHEGCDGLCETAAMGVISSLENRLTALSRHIGWTWTWALVGFSRHDPRKRGGVPSLPRARSPPGCDRNSRLQAPSTNKRAQFALASYPRDPFRCPTDFF